MKIEYRFDYRCTPEQFFRSLTSAEEIRGWWTDRCEMQAVQAGTAHFHWIPHNWRVSVEIKKLIPGEYVEWFCTESNMQNTDAWKGSTISFRIAPGIDGETTLQFLHDGYKNSPCFDECTAGWTFVLGKSLKGYLEAGQGAPFQNP